MTGEVLALTKMNWNNDALYHTLPNRCRRSRIAGRWSCQLRASRRLSKAAAGW